MTKEQPVSVLDVGQCDFDHGEISQLLAAEFGAVVDRAHTIEEARRAIVAGRYDLVLVNRVLDADASEGCDLIRQIKSDASLSATSVMLVSNFDSAQDDAVAAGAERGFGKSALTSPETISLLTGMLRRKPTTE